MNWNLFYLRRVDMLYLRRPGWKFRPRGAGTEVSSARLPVSWLKLGAWRQLKYCLPGCLHVSRRQSWTRCVCVTLRRLYGEQTPHSVDIAPATKEDKDEERCVLAADVRACILQCLDDEPTSVMSQVIIELRTHSLGHMMHGSSLVSLPTWSCSL